MQEESANPTTMKAGIAVMAVLFLATGALGILAFAQSGIAGLMGVGAEGDPNAGAEVWIEGQLADGQPGQDLMMATWSQDEAQGKIMVVVFFDGRQASGMAARDVNAMVNLASKRADLVVVGIAETESPDEAMFAGQRMGLMYPILFDQPDENGETLYTAMGADGVPSVWIVDGDGFVVRSNLHPRDAREKLEKLLE